MAIFRTEIKVCGKSVSLDLSVNERAGINMGDGFRGIVGSHAVAMLAEALRHEANKMIAIEAAIQS